KYKNRYCWLIHGRFDGTCPISYSINYARDINKVYPGHALLHEYGNGHCCWTTYYDPSWRWTNKGEKDIGEPHGMNIYSWFLKHSITKNKAEKTQSYTSIKYRIIDFGRYQIHRSY